MSHRGSSVFRDQVSQTAANPSNFCRSNYACGIPHVALSTGNSGVCSGQCDDPQRFPQAQTRSVDNQRRVVHRFDCAPPCSHSPRPQRVRLPAPLGVRGDRRGDLIGALRRSSGPPSTSRPSPLRGSPPSSPASRAPTVWMRPSTRPTSRPAVRGTSSSRSRIGGTTRPPLAGQPLRVGRLDEHLRRCGLPRGCPPPSAPTATVRPWTGRQWAR